MRHRSILLFTSYILYLTALTFNYNYSLSECRSLWWRISRSRSACLTTENSELKQEVELLRETEPAQGPVPNSEEESDSSATVWKASGEGPVQAQTLLRARTACCHVCAKGKRIQVALNPATDKEEIHLWRRVPTVTRILRWWPLGHSHCRLPSCRKKLPRRSGKSGRPGRGQTPRGVQGEHQEN